MISPAARDILRAFDDSNDWFKVEETDESTDVITCFTVPVTSPREIRFVCPSGGGVSLVVFGLLRELTEEDCLKLAPVVNDLNCRRWFLRFSLTEDGAVDAEYDLPLSAPPETMGDVCLRLYHDARFICRRAYMELIAVLD